MTPKRTAEILRIEKECVERQDTPRCNRDTNGCQCCDLIQKTEDVLEAYNTAIAWADNYDQIQAELDYIKAYSNRILGEWIEVKGGYYKCDKCGEVERAKKNFCSKCGAFMKSGLKTAKEAGVYQIDYTKNGHRLKIAIAAENIDEASKDFKLIQGPEAVITKIKKMEEFT